MRNGATAVDGRLDSRVGPRALNGAFSNHLSHAYGYVPARIGGSPRRDYPAGVFRRFGRPTSTESLVGYERFLSDRSRRHLPG
jgi:hypothetical protein